jgi:type IV pilus assembly protein PilQ
VGSGTTSSTTSTGSSPAFTVSSSSGTAAIGFQQLLGPNLNLNMALSLGETNGISKTVGSPRVIVNNKQSATVTDGVQIPTVTPGTANTPPTTTYTSASLSLNVTPQITSAGSVLMDVSIHKDAVSSSTVGGIDTKTLNTQVLVDSGATLVLGGVYQYTGQASSSGIPGLMDLPVIGALFRNDVKKTSKEELMVFITPQILDTGAQGITDKM